MEVAHRELGAVRLHLADVVLHEPDPVRVDAGGGEADYLAEAFVPLDAGAFDGKQREVHVDGEPKDAGDAVHGVPDAPGPRAGGEHELARPADDGGLVREAGVAGQLVALAHHVLPGGLHVVGVDAHAVATLRVPCGDGVHQGIDLCAVQNY